MPVSSPTTTEPATTDEVRPIPGLSMLGYGYDILKSPYCLDSYRTERLLDGLDTDSSSPVVLLSPNWKGGFHCPPIVQVLSEQVTNDDYSFFTDTVENYSSKLSVKVDISGSYGAFSGSIATSYDESKDTYLDNQYGEYGHVYSGVKVVLPHTAKGLRMYLNQEVKQKLITKNPDELIEEYGTHLIAGLVIGAKTHLLQSASRSEITTSKEFAAAVTAQYLTVTASASLDQTQTNTINKFSMSRVVHTLGGGNADILSQDDFKNWLAHVFDSPAVIDIFRVVPLYQLLDPANKEENASRLELKKAILRYAKRFLIGALYGTSQGFSDWSAQESLVVGAKCGNQLGRQNGIRWALSYSGLYGQGNSQLTLWQGTGQEASWKPAPQGMAVYGGMQQQSSANSDKPRKEMSSWGTNTHPPTQTKLKVWEAFTGFSPEGPYGEGGMSWVTLYVGPIEDAPDGGYVVVGGRTDWDDGTREVWGSAATGLVKEQSIARLKSWHSGKDGFQSCRVFLHLSPVQQEITEIPEG